MKRKQKPRIHSMAEQLAVQEIEYLTQLGMEEPAPKKVTIDELEKMLNSHEPLLISLSPDGGITTEPAKMMALEEANNYCKILTLLGLEEEGDPVAEIEHLLSDLAANWLPIESAPMDGRAFLAYGRHTGSPKDAQQGVEAGDHWWAIILYDVYREVGMGGSQFVFAKDGARTWSQPTHWRPLPAPPLATPWKSA